MTPSDGVGQQQSIDLRPGDPSRNPVREELRDFGICCDWFWIAAQNSSDDRWIATAAHESSHFFWGQWDRYGTPEGWDRYGTPEAFRGEVVARLSEGVQPARIFVERVDGPGSVLVGDRVRLKERAGRYMGVGLERLWLRGKPPSPAVVDLVDGVAGATTFRIGSDDRPVGTPLASGDIIRLTDLDWGNWLIGVPGGGHNGLVARQASRWPSPRWTAFRIENDSGGTIEQVTPVRLISAAGFGDSVGFEDARVMPLMGDNLALDLDRGYVWGGWQSGGPNGSSDNADWHGKNLVSPWDRISRGWASFRFLTPEQRGCYRLRPFLEGRETVIPFDRNDPREYYIVELRRRIGGRDEVPASGFYVSWNNTDQAYWADVKATLKDGSPFVENNMSHPVISARFPGIAANPLLRPISMDQNSPLRLNDASVAFTDPARVVVLPLGNGSPSRFRVSFSYREGNASGALCIH